jgi:hypothetical protein
MGCGVGKRVDWERIRLDYRTGKFTLRELESKHGASYSQISRKAKADAWEKDLKEVIRQATDATLLRKTAKEAQSVATDVVQAQAELNAQIIRKHRGDWAEVRDAGMSIIREAMAVGGGAETLERFATILAGGEPDDLDAMRKALDRALSLDKRSAAIQKAAEVIAKATAGERQAHSLDEDDGKGDPADDIWKRLSEEARG